MLVLKKNMTVTCLWSANNTFSVHVRALGMVQTFKVSLCAGDASVCIFTTRTRELLSSSNGDTSPRPLGPKDIDELLVPPSKAYTLVI